ncbi:MAG: type II toxin-antitoxin system VapC family toxin [Gemmatimonadota bacterium]|nr:type II toxin-antitoxin system VapC family toxin [Gemmatimonadota bacterium]
MTVVVDASVMVAALVDSGPDGEWAESVVSAETLAAPELVLVETTSILRRLERQGEISRIEANGACRDLLRRDIQFLPFAPFADRIRELRHNMSSYDAWYVAVAEAFESPLATLDRRLSRTVGVRCRFVVPGQTERVR